MILITLVMNLVIVPYEAEDDVLLREVIRGKNYQNILYIIGPEEVLKKKKLNS